MVSTARFAQGTPADLPILILNGEKDPVIAERVVASDEPGQAQTSIVLNGVGHGHLVDLFVQHAGCTDVTEVLYPDARHEVLAELEDVKLAATAEVVAFVERVCGENSVVSSSSSLVSVCCGDFDVGGAPDALERLSAWLTPTHIAPLSALNATDRWSQLPTAYDGSGCFRQEGRWP